ncbi:unnamed protein product [Acanthosepion pharaonis]|uniref:Uncharacterized protein n=1 Tax=Acanthosepion pharaonis TaxID=158019 RepID=A0A812EG56_ACAPH|nr:unnamed protein product [Sepia pharaonis]
MCIPSPHPLPMPGIFFLVQRLPRDKCSPFSIHVFYLSLSFSRLPLLFSIYLVLVLFLLSIPLNNPLWLIRRKTKQTKPNFFLSPLSTISLSLFLSSFCLITLPLFFAFFLSFYLFFNVSFFFLSLSLVSSFISTCHFLLFFHVLSLKKKHLVLSLSLSLSLSFSFFHSLLFPPPFLFLFFDTSFLILASFFLSSSSSLFPLNSHFTLLSFSLSLTLFLPIFSRLSPQLFSPSFHFISSVCLFHFSSSFRVCVRVCVSD